MRKKCIFCKTWDTSVELFGLQYVGELGHCQAHDHVKAVKSRRVTRKHNWCKLFTVNLGVIRFVLQNRQELSSLQD